MANVLDSDDILTWLDNVPTKAPTMVTNTQTLTAQENSGTSFEINRDVLLSLLEKVISVVPAKDIIPILTNLQFRVTDDRLTIVASSLEMTIAVTTSQVDVKTPGIELFPARTFMAVIKEAAANVFVEVVNNAAIIVAGNYSMELALSSQQGFPACDDITDTQFHSIDRRSFVDAIMAVKYALPGKEFSGLDSLRMISIKRGKFTAFDNSRFQQVRLDDLNLSMQLPAYAITNLLKTLNSTDQEIIEVGETAKRLVFRVGSTLLYINKLDEPYPNIEQLWLRPILANDQALLVNKQELLTAIKQVKVADNSSNAVGLIVSKDQIKVVARGGDNSATVVIDCTWEGAARNIVVNYIQLAEMLKAYKPEQCRFLLGKDTKTYKSAILLKDDEVSSIATIPQMHSYRVGLT